MVIFVLGPPDQVDHTNINVTIISIFQVLITWIRPFNNFAPSTSQIYDVYYEERNTGVSTGTNQSSDTTSVRLDLPVNTNYLLNIVNCNIVGCGPTTQYVSFTTITQGKNNKGYIHILSLYNYNCFTLTIVEYVIVLLQTILSICPFISMTFKRVINTM